MPSTLGTFIRHRRLQLGFSQQELAARAGHGIRQHDISRIERGAVTLPRWERLVALAAALELTAARGRPDHRRRPAGRGREPARSAPVTEDQPRATIRSPVGVIEEWETAAVFTCT
jgi:transcriptional regulator with XRE-family HTH domain